MTTAIEPRPPVFTPTKDLEPLGQEALIAQGKALRRTQTQFTTAIAVIKPRDRKEVIRACEEEATIAGDEFYYSWPVKGQRGSQLVEGLSIQGALSAARNWGNCAIPITVDDQERGYDFTATFLDLETGFNLQRIFRQRKQQNIGMKDKDRAEDIVFQIGQSKAIRNAILSALPSWLTSKMLAKAKENIIEKINKMGLAVARDKTAAFFGKYGVALANIEHKVGKKATAWAAEDLALLQGAMNALLAGQESAESLFPAPSEEVAGKTEDKAESLKQKLQEAKTSEAPLVKEEPEPEPIPGEGQPQPPDPEGLWKLKPQGGEDNLVLEKEEGLDQKTHTKNLINTKIFPFLKVMKVTSHKRAEALLKNRLGVEKFGLLSFAQAESFLDFLGEWRTGVCNVKDGDQGWVVEYPPR